MATEMSTAADPGHAATTAMAPMLEISGLAGGFVGASDTFTPVLQDVSFSVARNAITAIVGETGSGKSLTMLSVVGLTPRTFRRTGGTFRFAGAELPVEDERAMRAIRGSRIAMVFQNSRSALNPVFTIGTQLTDVCRLHRGVSRREARQLAVEFLARVYVSEPQRRLRQYPHELSGGTAQRVQIALALACEPELLVLDEPTTGLDVTIQADILDLIAELNDELDMTTCLITHDLGVVAQACEHVVVMRAGTVREIGPTQQIMTAPADPYTAQLLAASRIRRRAT
ncbi:MAG: peptide/nickel transport system ATP-binding protein ddpF [Gaiellales bacterium]|nr:peptide/nickel transport system ATP-binding protein ddpF [Gaiellales bacterium]